MTLDKQIETILWNWYCNLIGEDPNSRPQPKGKEWEELLTALKHLIKEEKEKTAKEVVEYFELQYPQLKLSIKWLSDHSKKLKELLK